MRKLLVVVMLALAAALAVSVLTLEVAAISMAEAGVGDNVRVEDTSFRDLCFIVKGSAEGHDGLLRRWIYVYAVDLNESTFVSGATADQWAWNAADHRGAGRGSHSH